MTAFIVKYEKRKNKLKKDIFFPIKLLTNVDLGVIIE
jgi:hypothetical protein